LSLAGLARSQDPAPAPAAALDAKALFLEHCARCHGERGDGQGWTELDRPARSFLDGGFSYGNTKSALVRSVRFGIPGTPMPAFPDEVLSADQREALADFVIQLGPPGTVVEPGASVLRVGDRPAVVRGMLPAMPAAPQDGASQEGGEDDAPVPRGLLIGFPTGTTFEYRADDVSLRAVRQGEFVDRRDWGDRGGLELEPLGAVVLDTRSLTRPMTAEASDASARPLRRALRGTDVSADSVHLRTALVDADRREFATLVERLCVIATPTAPVPARTLTLASSAHNRATLDARCTRALSAPEGARLEAAFLDANGHVQHVRRVMPGLFHVQRAEDMRTRCHFIHAPVWTPALETVVSQLEAQQ